MTNQLNLTTRDVASLLAKRCLAIVDAKALGPQKCQRLIDDVTQFSEALVSLLQQEINLVQSTPQKKDSK